MCRPSAIYLFLLFCNTSLCAEKTSCKVETVTIPSDNSCWTYEQEVNAPYCGLDSRGFKTIPSNLTNHKKLHVNLAGNKIKMIHRGQLNLPDCAAICLHSNKIKIIENSSFEHLFNLKILSLRGNKLNEIYSQLWKGLIHLQELDLAENHIHFLGQATFALLQNLLKLWLGENKISQVSYQFIGLSSKLQHLDIAYNKIAFINDQMLFALKSLSILFLNNNRNLANISATVFSQLSNLEQLSLCKCSINDIDNKAFFNLGKLSELYIQQNKLKTISSSTLAGLYQVEILYADFNELKSIANYSFNDLRNLKTLKLDHNSLSDINQAVWTGLSCLETLDLSWNNIQILVRNMFSLLIRCRRIYLQHNQIMKISEWALNGLNNLFLFDIRDNRLRTLDENILDNDRKVTSTSSGRTSVYWQYFIDWKHSKAGLGGIQYCSFCICQLNRVPPNVTSYMMFRYIVDPIGEHKCCKLLVGTNYETVRHECDKVVSYHTCHRTVFKNKICNNVLSDTILPSGIPDNTTSLETMYTKRMKKQSNESLKQENNQPSGQNPGIDKAFNIGISFVFPGSVMIISATAYTVWRVRKNRRKKKKKADKDKNAELAEFMEEINTKAEGQKMPKNRKNKVPEITITTADIFDKFIIPVIIITEDSPYELNANNEREMNDDNLYSRNSRGSGVYDVPEITITNADIFDKFILPAIIMTDSEYEE